MTKKNTTKKTEQPEPEVLETEPLPQDTKQMELEAAARFLLFSQFEKACKAGKAQARADLEQTMQAGDRAAVTLPSGKRVGKVTMTDPKEREVWEVTNEDALIDWMSQNYQEALEERIVIKPWFLFDKNLESVVARNNGELPPGLDYRVKQGTPYPRATLTVNERVAFVHAYQAGELTRPVLAEIEEL